MEAEPLNQAFPCSAWERDISKQYGSVKASTLCQSRFFNEPQRRRGHREKEEREEKNA